MEHISPAHNAGGRRSDACGGKRGCGSGPPPGEREAWKTDEGGGGEEKNDREQPMKMLKCEEMKGGGGMLIAKKRSERGGGGAFPPSPPPLPLPCRYLSSSQVFKNTELPVCLPSSLVTRRRSRLPPVSLSAAASCRSLSLRRLPTASFISFGFKGLASRLFEARYASG